MVREFESGSSIRNSDLQSDLAIDLTPEALRAYDSIVRPNAILPIPRYFIENWLPLLGASRAWLALAYRQVAFLSKSSTEEVPVQTTLRKLGRWCGLSHVRIHQLLKDPGYLNWFVRNANGELSERSSPRSQPTTYMVRSDIPLTPQDQSRLTRWFQMCSPEDDQGWIQTLESALEAKNLELPDDLDPPPVSLTIQQLVYAQRNEDTPLPPGVDQACTELHARWIQPDRVTLTTHYFLVRWLPDLSPGLGWLITLLRSRAYHQKDEFLGQVWIHGGWRNVADSLGVSRRSLTRWISSTNATLFFQRRSDAQDPTDRRNLLLAIRLSEPIHPSDQDEYQTKLEGQTLTSPIPLDRQSLTSSPLHPGQSLTSCGEPSTIEGKDLTTQGQDLPAPSQNLTSEVTTLNKDETKLNSLNISLRTSYQEHRQEVNSQQTQNGEVTDENVVVEQTRWQISEMLSHAGAGKRLRNEVEGASLQDQQSFMAWVLFALSTPSIQYPVLFAYKRNREASAPMPFVQLAQVPTEALYRWLTGEKVSNIPAHLKSTVQSLKKQRAHEKLLSMGAIHPSLDRMDLNDSEGSIQRTASGEGMESVAIRSDGMTAEKAWQIAKGQLQAELDKVAFDTWVKDVEYLKFGEGSLHLGVANDYAKDWLEDRLTRITERVVSGIVGEPVTVKFVLIYDDV